jgi:phytoene dehydrogenase-like protein
MAVAERYDCIVVGGGHNGLVCAAYLARCRRSVLVLEAGASFGGAAVTRTFAPGFRVSACAHLLQSLPRALVRELALESHGLRLASESIPTTALSLEGPSLSIGLDTLDGASATDAQAYVPFRERLRRLAAGLTGLMERTPPDLGTDDWTDRLALARLAWRVRRLGRTDMRELLRIAGMNVHDLLEEQFESELLKGALGFDAVLGSNLGPRSPGSVFTLLYRLAAAVSAGRPLPALPHGGLGQVAEALAAAARAAGASLRTHAPVDRIEVESDRVCGVRLATGEQVRAPTVISSVDPKTTLLQLLGSAHLDAGFVRRVARLRTNGLAAKLHLALDRLPHFSGVAPAALATRLVIAPSLAYLERAFNHSKYGEYSPEPALEITLPSIHDPQLAPPGRHVLSAIVQYAPYALAGGWDGERQRFLAIVLDRLEAHAPGLKASILAAELLTPCDIEAQFRIVGGHWHHTELALDQFFMLRPVAGAAQYAPPVDGLYLCGAGCHPGGGVMGVAGRNAARQVLARAG